MTAILLQKFLWLKRASFFRFFCYTNSMLIYLVIYGIKKCMDGKDGEIKVYRSNKRADYQKGKEYQEKRLKIAKEIGDQAGEGAAYGNLGIAYKLLGDCQKSIEYHNKHLKIAKEIGDRAGEGEANGNLGNAYGGLGEYENASEYHEKHSKIANEIGDQAGEGRTYGNLGNDYGALGDFQKAIKYHENFKRNRFSSQRRKSLWKSRYCIRLIGSLPKSH